MSDTARSAKTPHTHPPHNDCGGGAGGCLDGNQLEVTVRELHDAMQRGDDLLLLDCRRPAERETAAIQPSMFLPMDELAERVEELRPHAEREIVVYCHHGRRSLRVTRWLREHGFANARSMAGGIEQWSLEIDPTVPVYE